jgi:hypothetical protein
MGLLGKESAVWRIETYCMIPCQRSRDGAWFIVQNGQWSGRITQVVVVHDALVGEEQESLVQNVTYSDRLRQTAELLAIAEQLTPRLEKILGISLGKVQAEWDREKDAEGRPLLVLRLREWSGEVEGRFSREELKDPNGMNYLLSHLWGDLLEIRSKKQLQKLLED